MKSKIKKSGTGVKQSVQAISPRRAALSAGVFQEGLASLRAAYAVLLRAVLEKLRPRIEAGEFLRMEEDDGLIVSLSDVPTTVPASALLTSCNGMVETPPGIVLLTSAIEKLPLLQNEDAQRAIRCASLFVDGCEDGRGSFESAGCMAHDLRDLWHKEARQAGGSHEA